MPQFSDDLFLGTAQGYIGTNNTNAEAVITGSVSGTTMTVTAMNSGDSLVLGQYVNGTGITANSYITAFVSGAGGTGTYTLSASSSATGSITIYASGNAGLNDPSPMEVGVGPLGREYVWDVIPQALQAANIAASQTPAAAGNLTLTAGTSAKSVVRTDGTTVIQLDTPRALSITTGTAAAATLASVAITGTGGQISYTSQTGLVSGQYLTISGTLGGTGYDYWLLKPNDLDFDSSHCNHSHFNYHGRCCSSNNNRYTNWFNLHTRCCTSNRNNLGLGLLRSSDDKHYYQ